MKARELNPSASANDAAQELIDMLATVSDEGVDRMATESIHLVKMAKSALLNLRTDTNLKSHINKEELNKLCRLILNIFEREQKVLNDERRKRRHG